MASVRTIHVKLIDFGCAQKVSKLGGLVGANSVLDFTGKKKQTNYEQYKYLSIAFV